MDFLETIFIKFLNMSITTSYVILTVLLIRMCIKKAPKIISYIMWSVVAFRLVCPISFTSIISIFNLKLFDLSATQNIDRGMLEYVSTDILPINTLQNSFEIPNANNLISGALPVGDSVSSGNVIQLVLPLLTILWLVGIGALLVYGIVSYVKVKYLIGGSVLIEGNVYECDRIRAPFVLGFIKPNIYIPFRMKGQEREYILQHERNHIKRRDYLTKPIAFLILVVHWFNPLVWLAFLLMSKDMELSCDEKVLADMGTDIKHDYSLSLLSFSTKKRFLSASPLAFSETNTRRRVKNVLKFKKPQKRVILIAILICICATAICATNPIKPINIKDILKPTINQNIENVKSPVSKFTSIIIAGNYNEDLYKQYENHTVLFTNKDDLSEFITQNAIREDASVNSTQSKLADNIDFNNKIVVCCFASSSLAYIYYNPLYNLSENKLTIYSQIKYSEAQDGDFVLRGYFVLIDKDVAEKYQIKTIDNIEYSISLSPLYSLHSNFKNITPTEVKQKSSAIIYKDSRDSNYTTILSMDGEIYTLDIGMGGFGVIDIEFSEINETQYLIYSNSGGSGIHHSTINIFDLSNRRIVFQSKRQFMGDDLSLEKVNETTYNVCSAILTTKGFFADFILENGNKLGNLVNRNNQWEFEIIDKDKWGYDFTTSSIAPSPTNF